MRRQFLWFYLGTGLILVLAASVFSILILERFEEVLDQKTVQSVEPLVLMVQDRLVDRVGNPEPDDLVMDWINAISPYPVHFAETIGRFVPRDGIRRVHDGESLVVKEPGGRSIYASVGMNRIVHIGPIPSSGEAVPLAAVLGPPFAIVALIGLIVYFLIRPIERRVTNLTEVAGRFGKGELDSRVEVGSGGSLDELESGFNHMAGRIQKLIEAQKELLRAVSHDLRTPLARLFFALDDAQASDTAEEKNRHLRRIDRSLADLNKRVEEILTYTRLENRPVTLDLTENEMTPILREAGDLVVDFRPELEYSFSCDHDKVIADPRHLRRAVDNLITNAIRHARKRVWVACRKENGFCLITVDDDGSGVPEKESEKIFEPFYRLDAADGAPASGFGLGLAIVKRIMEAHQGSARAHGNAHGGASFVLSFPADPSASNRA